MGIPVGEKRRSRTVTFYQLGFTASYPSMGWFSQRLLRCLSTAFLLSLVAFSVGSMVATVIKLRRISSTSTSASLRSSIPYSCPPCSCTCPEQPQQLARPTGCGETDSDWNERFQDDRATSLKEEIELRETVARESLERIETAVETSKKTSVRYQKEASKCTARVSACERGRERAEAELIEERKLTKLWEKRARERGWSDCNKITRTMRVEY